MHDSLFNGDTEFGHYEVVDTIYAGRPARVLYSGNRAAAQSGMALDDKEELLFDYNQRFMELVNDLKPKSILLIGGGAFTFPKAVVERYPGVEIDIVELDPGLVEIAKQYFNFKPTPKTGVFSGDGREFLNQTDKKYDLILVDAFVHATIPEDLRDIEAIQGYHDHLNTAGLVAINIIATKRGDRSVVLNDMVRAGRKVFDEVEVTPASPSFSDWVSQNYIVKMQDLNL